MYLPGNSVLTLLSATIAALVTSPTVILADSIGLLTRVRHFDAEDGLISPYVTSLATDEGGQLWVGTVDGLATYDGRMWRSAVASRLPVHCVLNTRDYGVVAGTDVDAYSVSRSTGGQYDTTVWTPFEHPYLRSSRDSLARTVYAMDERASDGAIWFATQTGAKLYDVYQWVAIDTSAGLPTDTVTAIAAAGGDSAWIGTPQGLYLRTGERDLSQPDNMPPELEKGAIRCLLHDTTRSALWIGTPRGLFIYRGNSWERVVGMETPGGWVYSIAMNSAGTLYAGGDFAVYRMREGIWSSFDVSHPVRALAADANDIVWLGTYGGGVYMWPDREEDTESRWFAGRVVAMISTPAAPVVLATDRELWQMSDNGTITPAFRASPWGNTHAIAASTNGTIWLATDGGVFGVRDGRIVLALDHTSLLGGSAARSLAYDPVREELWIGADSGVWRMNQTSYRLTTWSESEHNELRPIAVTPDGIVWMATPHGVFAVGANDVQLLAEADGINLGRVLCGTTTSDGSFWFGDDCGHVARVAAYDSVQSGVKKVSDRDVDLFDARNGIRGEAVRSIVEAPDSSLWVATGAGLNRYDAGAWAYYGPDEGLRSRDAWSVMPLLPDLVLAGTSAGLELLRPDINPPETEILHMAETVASEGDLVAAVRARDFWKHTPDELMRVSWQLDDGAWSPAVRASSIALEGLEPGRHTLRVRAVDGDLNVDPSPAEMEFTVEQPVWRRWYVVLIFVLILADNMGLTILYMRERAKRECSEEL